MKRLLILIGLVAVIPICGYLIGSYIINDYDNQFINLVSKELGSKGTDAITSGRLSLQQLCESKDDALNDYCVRYNNVQVLQKASLAALLTGLALLLIIFLAARICAFSRVLLVNIFSSGIKVVLLTLFFIILLQGAIATYSAYLLESVAIHSVHFILIGGIGLGALAGSFAMISAGLSISKRATTHVIGKTATTEEEPKLWGLINNLAAQLGATPPQNIVLGLEPNFYVTSADVIVYPATKKLPGETLYLSLPLMRILSSEELSAVIGHELGHFRGKDTKFSLRFYPIYAGTIRALAALENENNTGSNSLALIPAMATLSFLWSNSPNLKEP